MKYDHLVKHNGIFYKAGEEVPEEGASFSVDVQKNEGDADTSELNYSKTDIAKMNVASLRELGGQIGIAGVENKSGTVLKAEIVERLGL